MPWGLDAQTLEYFRREQSWLGIPFDYRDADVDHCDDRVRTSLRYIVNQGPDVSHKTGILLYGPTGTGKTYAAYAIMNRILRFVPSSRDFLKLTTAESLVNEVKAAGCDAYHVMAEYSGAGILMIDELGGENWSDFTTSTILGIIDKRVSWRRKTIITSNVAPKTWRNIEPRIASRLMTYFHIKFDGEDLRLKRFIHDERQQ